MLQLKMNYSLFAERIIETLYTSIHISNSFSRIRVLRNDGVLLFDNQAIIDLLQIIKTFNVEVFYEEYKKQKFDKYLETIIYKI